MKGFAVLVVIAGVDAGGGVANESPEGNPGAAHGKVKGMGGDNGSAVGLYGRFLE